MIQRIAKSGFTLLEVLISLMILGVVTVTIFTVFSQTLNTWRKAAADMEKYGNARAFLDRISLELSGATIDRWSSIYFAGFSGGSGPRGSSFDELYFVSNAVSGDFAEIGYWLAGDGTLMRYYRNANLEFDRTSYDLFSGAESLDEVTEEGVASNISGLFFSFWKDGSTAWNTSMPPMAPGALRTWDSRPGTTFAETSTPFSTADDLKLPKAVRITLLIKDTYTQKNEYFSTVVYIPEAEVHNP